jgi:iron complex outermembrane receptor protein
MRQLTRIESAALLLAPIVAPVAVFAQAPLPLEEIRVTATRIEKRLSDVPAALTVIGQDVIQLGRQQLALDESLSRVPGVFLQNRYNFAQDLRVSIRGFGARANFGIRGIKILVDGIPETLPDGQGSVDGIDIGSTSQIEVLRGPSSSIWGNASGGVISVTTERAPREPFSEVRVTAGEYDFRKLQFKTGAQGDRVGYLVSVSDLDVDGYRAQSRAENTQLTGRFNFDLGSDRELVAVMSYTDQPTSDDAGGINAAQVALDRTSARDANIVFNGGESLEQTRLGLVFTTPLGNGELTARNYYAWRDFENHLPFVGGGNVDLDRSFAGGGVSYAMDAMWGGRPNTLIFGIDIDQQDDDRLRYDNLQGLRGPLSFNQNETVRSRGIFAQNDLSLSDTISLSFGIRFDEVEFDVSDRSLGDGNDSGTVSLDDASPMFGVSVELSDTLNLYGTYSSAFETPTTTEFNRPDGLGGFNTDLKPQVARNLEVGLRGEIGDRSRYEVSVFSIKVDDELIPFEIAATPGRNFFANAGESTRNGIEFSLVSNPTERISTTFSYTYADYEFDSFVDGRGNNFSGNRIPGTAKDVLFGEVTYTHPRGWFASFDMIRIGDQFANNANSVSSDGYTVGNFRVGWDHESETMQISPFVGINNLFDESYIDNLRINAFGGRFFEPAPDRNIYAGATLRFGR